MAGNFVWQISVFLTILFHILEVRSVPVTNLTDALNEEGNRFKKMVETLLDRGREIYDGDLTRAGLEEGKLKAKLDKIGNGVLERLKVRASELLKKSEDFLKKEQEEENRTSKDKIQDLIKGSTTEMLTKEQKNVETILADTEDEDQGERQDQNGWSWIILLQKATQLFKGSLIKNKRDDEASRSERQRRDTEEDWSDYGEEGDFSEEETNGDNSWNEDECAFNDTGKDCPKKANKGLCASEPDSMLCKCQKSCLCNKRSTNDSCDKVLVGVPDSVKKSHELHDFYKKYTSVYGVPIVSSEKVSDNALKRACYVVKFLLADRQDIRNSFYFRRGRGGVIGINETTRMIPEHSYLPADWNETTRGLGGTRDEPISTGGEENLLCNPVHDKYPNEDIFLHEFSHGIMLIAVADAIPDFEERLEKQFENAKKQGLWSKTYAISDYREYFAEGVQSYFDVNDEAIPANDVHNHVNTRTELKKYDAGLYALVKEVFPCENKIKKRCDKDGKTPVLKKDCKVKKTEEEKTPGNM